MFCSLLFRHTQAEHTRNASLPTKDSRGKEETSSPISHSPSSSTMPINRESVPPPTIGKIGPYTVFMTPPTTPKPPLDPCPEVVLPPVLPPPQQFHKSAASDDDRTFLGFFKNALDKVHNAHSSLDDHMARWLGLNQSKYQWALDDYYETKGLEKEGLKAKECSNKQQQV